VRAQPWDGKGALEDEKITYYGGYTQKDVKPTPDSPLLRLGMDKVPPIVTSAVLLDARAFVGGGKPMAAGDLVSAKHVEGMLKAQGLARRGILPGDVARVFEPRFSTTTSGSGLGLAIAHRIVEEAAKRHKEMKKAG